MKRFLLLLLLATPCVIVLCLMAGSFQNGIPDLSDEQGRTILQLRAYRMWAGIVTGAALATSGAVLQALLRNPLAEPYVLGVSSGAGLGAALAIVTGLSTVSALGIPAMAFVFSIAALYLVYRLGTLGGHRSMYGILLSGVIISAICSNAIMAIISLTPNSNAPQVIWWMLGNLEQRDITLLHVSTLIILLGIALLWTRSHSLNVLTLGSDVAHHVGVRTEAIIPFGLGLATLVTSCAVAISGLIGFVGLIVPHVVRSCVGPDHRKLIPYSAWFGGLFLALCDALGRALPHTISNSVQDIPVGVITALFGGPFFLWVLRQKRRTEWTE